MDKLTNGEVLKSRLNIRSGVEERLQKADILIAQGMPVIKACRNAKVSPSTYRKKRKTSLPAIPPKPAKPSPTIVNLELQSSEKILVLAGDCGKVKEILSQLGKVML